MPPAQRNRQLTVSAPSHDEQQEVEALLYVGRKAVGYDDGTIFFAFSNFHSTTTSVATTHSIAVALVIPLLLFLLVRLT